MASSWKQLLLFERGTSAQVPFPLEQEHFLVRQKPPVAGWSSARSRQPVHRTLSSSRCDVWQGPANQCGRQGLSLRRCRRAGEARPVRGFPPLPRSHCSHAALTRVHCNVLHYFSSPLSTLACSPCYCTSRLAYDLHRQRGINFRSKCGGGGQLALCEAAFCILHSDSQA